MYEAVVEISAFISLYYSSSHRKFAEDANIYILRRHKCWYEKWEIDRLYLH